MLLGLLLSNGFTSRLANEAAPVPISEDSREGAYKMLKLDSFLVREETKFSFFVECLWEIMYGIYLM